MPAFKKAAPPAKKQTKPDRRGKITVRIFLLDERSTELFPLAGNLREDLFVEDATVGEVAKVLSETLFGPGEKVEENSEQAD